MKPPQALTSPRTRLAVFVLLVVTAAGVWWTMTSPAAETGIVTGSGTIEADEIALGAEVGGRVAALQVDEGADVTAGAVLATLDTAVLDAQMRQADAAIEVARANLALVQQGARDEEVRQAEGAVA